MRLRWALLAVIALALGFSFVRPDTVRAHAVLERSLPVQNQRLQEPPELVETWYSEPLERSLTTLQVLNTQGDPVHVGETLFSADDQRYAAIAVPPDLGPGIYTLTFENVSTVDSHVWSGFFSFVILNPDGTVPAGEALIPGGLAGQTGFLPENADSILRWLGLLAAVALGGGLFFVLLVARPAAGFLRDDRARLVERSALGVAAATVVPAAVFVIVSTVGQLLVLAEQLGRLGELDGILFDTRNGQLWAARIGISLALLLLFLPALRSEAYRAGRHAALTLVPGAIGGLGLLVTYSLASHAAVGGGQFWTIGSDLVHFTATAAWLGALVPLALLFWWARRHLEGAPQLLYLANVLDRFSWLAAVSATLLIGTGVFNSFVQLPTLPSFYETTYGRVLIAKLALILPLLGVAGLNAFYLKPALVDAVDALHDEDRQQRPSGRERGRLEARLQRLRHVLPRVTIAEIALGAAVLASVSILSQTTTADGELRLDASRPSGEFTAPGDARDLEAELSIAPFGIGLNTFAVTLQPSAGAELGEVLGVRLTATFDNPNVAPSAGISGVLQELEPTDDPAVWAVEAVLLTQPGDWNVQARIRRRDLDDADAIFAVSDVGGYLARPAEPAGLFDLPFTFVDWNIVAGGALLAAGLGVFLIWYNRPPVWERTTSTSVGLSSAFAMMAGVVLLFGVHAHEEVVGSSSPIEATAASLAIGNEVFTTNCMTCHGATGEGDGPGAAVLAFPPPRLGDHVPFHNDATLFLWISEGIPLDSEEKNMPSFKSLLSEDERWHVINFLRATYRFGDFEPVLPDDLTQESEGR